MNNPTNTTMNRRNFFSRALIAATVLGAVRFGKSDPDVPPALDVAKGDSGAVAIRIYLDGVEQKRVVAYDLNEQWVRRLRVDPNGNPIIVGDHLRNETVRGKVVVLWDREQLSREAARA